MDESMKEERVSEMPMRGAVISKLPPDPVTEKLRNNAIDSLNAYLIRMLELKNFCIAKRIGSALERFV